MTTDLFSRAKIADGEGIDPTDLEALSAAPIAILWDQLVASLVVESSSGTEPYLNEATDLTTIPYAIALTVAGGRPIPGSANNKIKITRGTLCQAIAAPTGAEAKLLAFRFAGTDEYTIANGDATNPRIDLLQMQLSYLEDTPVSRDFQDAVTRALSTSPTTNSRRRVQCALTIKQGTPAASPTYPTLDAGCVAIGAVMVGATYAGGSAAVDEDTAGAVLVLHDQRMPVSISAEICHAQDMFYDVGSITSISGVENDVLVAGASKRMIAVVTPSQGRLVQVAAPAGLLGTVDANLMKWILSDARVSAGLTSVPISLGHAGGMSSVALAGPVVFTRRIAKLSQVTHLPAAGPTIAANAAGVGPPLWTSGRRCPHDPRTLNTTSQAFESLALMHLPAAASSLSLGPVTFLVARGLL